MLYLYDLNLRLKVVRVGEVGGVRIQSSAEEMARAMLVQNLCQREIVTLNVQ